MATNRRLSNRPQLAARIGLALMIALAGSAFAGNAQAAADGRSSVAVVQGSGALSSSGVVQFRIIIRDTLRLGVARQQDPARGPQTRTMVTREGDRELVTYAKP
jgi:hypothetical protein